MTTDNFCFYYQNRLIQTIQTGGEQYSDTLPFRIPWLEREIGILDYWIIVKLSNTLCIKVMWIFYLTLALYMCMPGSLCILCVQKTSI
jgi:hypothetical protein